MKNKLYIITMLFLSAKITYSYTPLNPLPSVMYPYDLYGVPNSFDNIVFYGENFSVVGPGSLILTNNQEGQIILGPNGSITQTSQLTINTQGLNTIGISASGGTVEIIDVNSLSIVNEGENSIAINTENTGIMNITGDDFLISNSGNNSIGINTSNTTNLQSKTLVLNNTGNDSIGILALEKELTIDASDSMEIKSNGYGIVSEKDANVKISGGAIKISSTENTILSKDNSKVNILGNTINLKTNTKEDIVVKSSEFSEVTIDGNEVMIIGNIEATDNSIITSKYNNANSFLTGKITTDSDAITNMTLLNKAKWNVSGNSNVTNIIANEGIFNLAENNSEKITLDIKSLQGTDNTFVLKLFPANPDFINIVEGLSTSKNNLEISKNSIPSVLSHNFTNSPIYFADVDSNISFKSTTSFEQLGYLYDYKVELNSDKKNSLNGENWYIEGIKKVNDSNGEDSSSSNVSVNKTTKKIQDFTALRYTDISTIHLEVDTLYKRLGEIREYKEKQGVWFRNTAGKMKNSEKLTNKYYMTQVGYDNLDKNLFGESFTGIAFQYRYSDLDFLDGSGKGNSYGISLYRTYLLNNNQYLDLIGKYTYIDNKLNTTNRYDESINGKYHTNGGTLGIEYGKRIYTESERYYLQPIVQTKYTHLSSTSYTTNSGFKIHEDSVNSFIGKAGVYMGIQEQKINSFLKLAILKEFKGDYKGTITGYDGEISGKNNAKDSWVEIGVGVDYKIKDDFFVYSEIERTLNSDFEVKIQGTLGFRYSF